MRRDYATAIRESAGALAARERQLRGRRTQVRVRMLRLLKSGAVPSLRACAPLLGYEQRQLGRWWQAYERGGLAALLVERRSPGKPPRMTAEAWAGLTAERRAGRLARLADARRYLRETGGIAYSTSGMAGYLRRRRVKLKTGRRRHARADAARQAGFKQTSPPNWRRPGRRSPSPATRGASG
jgi:transposase